MGYKHPYNLNTTQLNKIKSVLQAQRPLVRHYWASAGDFESLFKTGDAVVGAGWPLMTVDLKRAHVPVSETVPKQGATGWADTWMLSSHSTHTACAYAWMNYALSPAVQAKVVAVTGYSPANLETAAILGPAKAKALHITDAKHFNTLKFWQTRQTTRSGRRSGTRSRDSVEPPDRAFPIRRSLSIASIGDGTAWQRQR